VIEHAMRDFDLLIGEPGECIVANLSRDRLDLLGGELRVESIPGDGTRARLRFPQRRPSELDRTP